ncbi:protein DEFECTIVE IN MERISTEM SILENCING 3 [Asparagus officinalis]|uniref:protein DEFECTIVE IN MERISTEM SILENCING 3 n=1 Tax=Asparagus officinalis TaxID=4686 RepID=UPI00098DF511|nr:protein DEFECTIVE IN MERISTEM SILENCING 3 [Asparagus officinalis]
MCDGKLLSMKMLQSHTQQKLNDDIQKLALKVKHHEDNMKFLKTQINKVDDSILDMQVDLGKHHASREAEEKRNNVSIVNTEKQTTEQILLLENTAAGVICQLKVHHGSQASKLPVTKDVLGVVSTLGKANDDNFSRLLSEFLGLETMLAIVCKTYEGVKALERYDKEGMIDKSSGLHGLGLSIGRLVDGRFRVICLEHLRPYIGELLPEDPEKRLALLKPRLSNGNCPPGFCGFAVNMISIDSMYLSCLTSSGHGLRETLFYSLFSRVQVYETRGQMLDALPCINDGAISLDGGIMRSNGLFLLGGRNEVKVRFPVSSRHSSPPEKESEIEEQIRLLNWKKERIVEDMHREEALLNQVKESYIGKKDELLELLKYVNTNSI